MKKRNAVVFKSWPSPFADDDVKEAERRNGDKLDNLHDNIITYGNKLMDDFSDMNDLYNK